MVGNNSLNRWDILGLICCQSKTWNPANAADGSPGISPTGFVQVGAGYGQVVTNYECSGQEELSATVRADIQAFGVAAGFTANFTNNDLLTISGAEKIEDLVGKTIIDKSEIIKANITTPIGELGLSIETDQNLLEGGGSVTKFSIQIPILEILGLSGSVDTELNVEASPDFGVGAGASALNSIKAVVTSAN